MIFNLYKIKKRILKYRISQEKHNVGIENWNQPGDSTLLITVFISPEDRMIKKKKKFQLDLEKKNYEPIFAE